MHEEVNSPVLKVMLDTVPMVLSDNSIEAYGTIFGGDLMHIHFLDGDGKTSSHLAWGQGVFPLDSFKRELKKIQYDKYLTLELIGPQYNWNPEKGIRESLVYLDI